LGENRSFRFISFHFNNKVDMIIGVWIQLFRNLLCVMKALLPTNNGVSKHLLWQFRPLPNTVMQEVTVLEMLIALTQFAGTICLFIEFCDDVNSGTNGWWIADCAMVELDRYALQGTTTSHAEFVVLRHSIVDEQRKGLFRIMGGLLKLVIAWCFLIFAFDSLHLGSHVHPNATVSAMVVLVLCVVCGLFQFVNRISAHSTALTLSKSLKAMLIANHQKFGDTISPRKLVMLASDLPQAQNFMTIYQLIIHPGYFPRYLHNNNNIKDAVSNDLLVVRSRFLQQTDTSSLLDLVVCSARLEKWHYQLRWKLVMTTTLFVLNLIAGVGYFIAILSHYCPLVLMKEADQSWLLTKPTAASKPVGSVYGSLLGDLAWTIEPLIILSAAALKVACFGRETGFDGMMTHTQNDDKLD
jgi:ABC-type multidrug transport system fused ATPase/permease subunit